MMRFVGESPIASTCLFAICILIAVASPARALDAGAAYAGRDIDLYIGAGAGSGLDTIARLLARRIGKRLPGNPIVTPRNMVGGNSLRVAEYLANEAPRDGAVIGALNASAIVEASSPPLDAVAFSWLGAADKTSPLSRAFAAPPGAPADHVALLRRAFLDALGDPETSTEAQRIGLDIAPVSGEDIQALVANNARRAPRFPGDGRPADQQPQ